ncbi:MAG TPA: nucleotidyltransferase family protein [Burkholderiales bacterium]|jgi:molybdenum cofactor cytidylyltransferase|nr:nucleotidyltransferase family protein [Burkholderiales bacterium]
MNVAAILLAAGKSSRFGANKLLHPLQGVPIALHAAASLKAAFPDALAVVSPGSPLQALLENAGLRTVVSERAHEGMGESLKSGITATSEADGWVVALADMPFIRPTTHLNIERALRRGAAIAAPAYQGERGHPVGLSGRFRNELLALTGDAGARFVLKQHAQEIHLVEVDDPGVLKDIDTPQDLPAA